MGAAAVPLAVFCFGPLLIAIAFHSAYGELNIDPCDRSNHLDGTHCYYKNDADVSYLDAIAFCKTQGGVLAKVSSDNDKTFIKQEFFNGDAEMLDDCWLGANDADTEGGWKWLDGYSLRSAVWEDDHPRPGKLDCLVLTKTYKMKDVECIDPDNKRLALCHFPKYEEWELCHEPREGCPPNNASRWEGSVTYFLSNATHYGWDVKGFSTGCRPARIESGPLAAKAMAAIAAARGRNGSAVEDVWLALNDNDVHGVLRWDDDHLISWANWEPAATQPALAFDRDAPGGHCVALDALGRWTTPDCQAKKHVLCENAAVRAAVSAATVAASVLLASALSR